MNRRALAGLGVLCAAALMPDSAHADPPGPTDYLTQIVSIEPTTDVIDVEIVGGDSFVMMTVSPGSEVDVVGYHGEPYLRFLPDGEVLENRGSPTYHASLTRYGSAIPAGIDASSDPRWERVGGDATFAWHDHRTHWMNEFRPPGKQPGDVILQATVPLVVDGAPTSLAVDSTWLPAPSRAPLFAGAGVGAVAAAFALVRPRSVATLAAVASITATVIGGFAYVSVPPETDPSLVVVLLPLVAGAAALAALLARYLHPSITAVGSAIAGAELAVWGWTRRGHLSAALLPTDVPYWVDRGATVAVLLTATSVVAAATHQLVTDR